MDHLPGDLSDRLTATADRHHQRTEIVDRADKNAAEDHPQQCRPPPPNDGDRRTDDRAGAGDRREVVPE